jgi:hypothetical protein
MSAAVSACANHCLLRLEGCREGLQQGSVQAMGVVCGAHLPILRVCRSTLCPCLLERSTAKACILARCSSLKLTWYRSSGFPAMAARSCHKAQ